MNRNPAEWEDKNIQLKSAFSSACGNIVHIFCINAVGKDLCHPLQLQSNSAVSNTGYHEFLLYRTVFYFLLI